MGTILLGSTKKASLFLLDSGGVFPYSVRMNLLDKTNAMLHASKKSVPAMSRESGINRHWLMKFKQKQIGNPGVVTIQKLHDYLIKS